MSRDEAIALLISDAIERVVRLRQVFWLQTILESGFAGYARFSDEDLKQELLARGFGREALADSADGGDDDHGQYDEDLQGRLADCAGYNH